jgi:hypothetical protein
MEGISVAPDEWDESAEPASAYGTYTLGPTEHTEFVGTVRRVDSASVGSTASGLKPTPDLDAYRPFSLRITPDGVQVEEIPKGGTTPGPRDAEFSTLPDEGKDRATSVPSGPSPSDVYAVMQSLASKPRSLDGIKQEVRLGDDALFVVLGALSKARLITRGTKKDSEATVFVLTPLGQKLARRFISGQGDKDNREAVETSKRVALPPEKKTGKYRAVRLGKGSTLQDVHTVGKERGSLDEETPFKTLRPEDVNPQLKGQKPLPKEVLQPMEMRVQSDRGMDTRDATDTSDAEKRTQILMERAKKERKEKGKFGVEQTDKPSDQNQE